MRNGDARHLVKIVNQHFWNWDFLLHCKLSLIFIVYHKFDPRTTFFKNRNNSTFSFGLIETPSGIRTQLDETKGE